MSVRDLADGRFLPNAKADLPGEVDEQLAMLATLVKNAPVGFAFLDLELRFVRANEAFLAIEPALGRSMIGKKVPEVLPHFWSELEVLHKRVKKGERVLNHEFSGVILPETGRMGHWMLSCYPVSVAGEVIGIGVIVNDISARKQAEAALNVRKDLYAMLARTGRAVSQCVSAEVLYKEVCGIAVETGHFQFAKVSVAEGNRMKIVASAGDDKGYTKDVTVTLEEGDPRSHGPTGRAMATGETRIVNDFMGSASTAPWREYAGRVGIAASAGFPLKERGRVVAVLTLYASKRDFFTAELVKTLEELMPSISLALDSLAKEEARKEAEKLLELRDRAIRAVSQGILITDACAEDNPIVFASPGFERVTGYTAEEVIGRNCRFLQGPETDREMVEKMRAAVSAGVECTVELKNYRKDGSTFWNNVAISPVVDGSGKVTHLVGVQTDVTERRRLEDQYRQSQKMEAVGQLAGGVAHDFANQITVIYAYANLLLDTLGPTDPMRESLREIIGAGDRSAALTRQLLAFSRKQVLSPKVLSVNEIVKDMERMLRRMIGEDVRLEARLEEELWNVRVDRGSLEQVVMNLAVNSRDAMKTGGVLTIVTGNDLIDARRAAEIGGLKVGEYVRLSVSDTGTGMTEEVQKHIFEPFFTTKGVGAGTGLGLSVVHGIIQQSGGVIRVKSEVGLGTSFDMYLPRMEARVAEVAVKEEALGEMGGKETVLVVEDEDALRAAACQFLKAQGYTVLSAGNAAEAMALVEFKRDVIHLLVTDVVMPGMGGGELAARVLKERPKVKVLYISGYTDDVVVKEGVLEERVQFLSKPFTMARLAKQVRSILDQG